MDSIEQPGIVIEIEEDLAKRIAALAGEGRTASDLANDVLRSFADEAEEFMDTAEDERRWREYQRTGETVSFEKIERKLLNLEKDARSRMKHP